MNSYISSQSPAGDFEKITVSTVVKQIDATKLKVNQSGGKFKRAVRAFLTVETNTIRIRFDGTDPDSSTGHSLVSGDSIVIEGEQNVSKLRMIRASADATVQVTIFYNQ